MSKEQIKKKLKVFGLIMLVYVVVFFTVSTAVIFLINIIYELIDKTFITGSLNDMKEVDLSMSTITSLTTITTYKTLLYIVIFFSFIGSSFLTFKLVSNYGNLNKNQKGRSRFATLKEIQSQYRAVPDKGERFDGSGGVPIARYKNKLYIDDSSVNNLLIGTTRSGKGEAVVFSIIDIYSRAKTQSSMVINDPKGELFSASKPTLEKLGYNVQILNLMTPEQSLSYNILEPVKSAFLNGDKELAVRYARSIAHMLYHEPNAKEPVWWKSSASLCTALILGVCEQFKNEPEKINMYNCALMLSDLGSRKIINENGEKVYALDDYFHQFPVNHPARLQFATVNFSEAQMRASILANTNSELEIFTIDGIAKLTSQTSFDTTKVGYERWIKGIATPHERIKIKFPDGKVETTRTNGSGIFTIFFDSNINKDDELKYSINEKEGSLQVGEEDKEGYYKVISNTDDLSILELVQYKKPTAVFMVTPDYDTSLNVVVSIFVKQVYTELSRIASTLRTGECQREVIFLLDEFGNMPAIEDFTNILTVCLGRKIRFNLVVQSYSQLEEIYDKGWRIIDDNCGNTLYLLTSNEETADRISKKIGEKTIVTKSRTGQPISLSKSKTESIDSQRLLRPEEVMALKEGEMLVIRVIKRQDKERKRIRSYPIYLKGKTALKYRWEYLSKYYDTDKAISDYDIDCEHAMLNLDELKGDFSENNYYKENTEIRTTDAKTHEGNRENNKIEMAVKDTKREHQKEMIRKKKEKETNKKINESIITKDVIDDNLLMKIFNDSDKSGEYKSLGLIDFRDYLISISSEVEESFVEAIMTKIDSAILEKTEEIKGEKEKIGS